MLSLVKFEKKTFFRLKSRRTLLPPFLPKLPSRHGFLGLLKSELPRFANCFVSGTILKTFGVYNTNGIEIYTVPNESTTPEPKDSIQLKCVQKVHIIPDSPHCGAMTPNTDRLVIGCKDTVYLFDETCQLIKSISVANEVKEILEISISYDGKKIGLVGVQQWNSTDGGKVCLIDVETERCVKLANCPPLRESKIAFHPTDTMFAWTFGERIYVLDFAKNRRRTFKPNPNDDEPNRFMIADVKFYSSEDSELLLIRMKEQEASSSVEAIYILDLAKESHPIVPSGLAGIIGCTISENGKYYATHSKDPKKVRKQKIRIWEVSRKKLLGEIDFKGGFLSEAGFKHFEFIGNDKLMAIDCFGAVHEWYWNIQIG